MCGENYFTQVIQLFRILFFKVGVEFKKFCDAISEIYRLSLDLIKHIFYRIVGPLKLDHGYEVKIIDGLLTRIRENIFKIYELCYTEIYTDG